VEWGMVIMGYVLVRLKYPDVSQPVHKTDSSDESVKKYLTRGICRRNATDKLHFCKYRYIITEKAQSTILKINKQKTKMNKN
jgi:hypothetical protein